MASSFVARTSLRMTPLLPAMGPSSAAKRAMAIATYSYNRTNNKPKTVQSSKRSAAYERQEKFWNDLEKNDRWVQVVKKFDVDGSKSLDDDELASLIREFGHGTITPDGVRVAPEPDDDEIEWIMKVLKTRVVEFDASQIKFALDLWHAYESNKHDIDAIFKKYDKDGSDSIDKAELKALLMDFNEGGPLKVNFCER